MSMDGVWISAFLMSLQMILMFLIPDHILQIKAPEKVYKQWLNTQGLSQITPVLLQNHKHVAL